MTNETETQSFTKVDDSSSSISGVSVRAWVTLFLVLGVVGNQLLVTVATLVFATMKSDFALVGTLTTIGEPFYTLSSIAIGFYFGQKLKP